APTPRPAPRPPAAPPAPAPTAAPPAAVETGPWRFAWTTEARQFRVRTEADVARAGERERVETTGLVTVAVLPVQGGSPRGVSARVDSLLVRASERVAGRASPGPAAPATMRGTISARGAVRLESEAAAAGCASPGGAAALTALGLAREVMPRVPATLTAGLRWRDTTSVAGCAGPLPVTVQTVVAYEVEGAERGAVRVRRRTTSTLRGQGFAGGQAVRVAGTGSADAVLVLDAGRGALREGSGEGTSTVTLTMGTAVETFSQQTRVRVEPR
ncbi:hypothetical protein PYV61_19100, partial [Roseisolibacter sp. H3M3-2]